ncbi:MULTISPECIES: hypothetical protein [unclassified Agrococcus]|uniref:hypothetical protein n=1 Tax=unclassified Agrococcus TaxID=2615065 RepID=UPI00360DAC9B
MSDASPQPGDRIPSLDPPPAVVGRIDGLAAASRDAPGDPAAAAALWRAVLGLDRWICIARGSDDQPTPFLATFTQGPMLLAFTTAERARVGGLSVGLAQEEVGRLLAVPLPAAIEWAASYEQGGVHGLLLDQGTTGAFTPLANLVPMRDWFAANPG